MYQWSEALDKAFERQMHQSVAEFIKNIQEEGGNVTIKHWIFDGRYICTGISMKGVFVNATRTLCISNGIVNFQRRWRLLRLRNRRLAVAMGWHRRLGASCLFSVLDQGVIEMILK